MKIIQMSLEDVLAQLEGWQNEKRREINAENGAGMNQFGLGKVQLRDLAKKLKKNHELAMQLWHIGNTDAMLFGNNGNGKYQPFQARNRRHDQADYVFHTY